MKDLGYGQNYQYAHNYKDAKVDQQHLPDGIKNEKFYTPGNNPSEQRWKKS
jgi:putative ATPase